MMKTLIPLIIILFAGCSHKVADQARNVGGPENATLTLSDQEALARISVTRPELAPYLEESTLTGRIDFDPNQVTRVYSPVNGLVATVRVNLGDHVRRGDVLAEIRSGDLAGAVSDYQKARAGLKIAEKNIVRARELYTMKILSQRDLQQAISDSTQARAEYERSSRVMEILNASKEGGTSVFELRAPIDGNVLERTAQLGSQVRSDNSQYLFTIGRTQSVQVMLDVYQDQFQKISAGDSVAVTVDGARESPFASRLNFVSSAIDPATMTGKARCAIENRNGLLRPAMYCSAQVFHPMGRVSFLPASSAFYDGDGRTYVFVKTAADKFLKREIRAGRMLKDRVEVIAGVGADEEVVVNRAIFLNEELQFAIR